MGYSQREGLLKRVKRRYLALEINAEEKFDSKQFMDAVWNALLKLYGEYGASKASLTLIDYNREKGFAVIRTTHTSVDMARAALASITKIENKPAAIHILTISGTIKTLYKKIKQYRL
jgi:RNase P/RNase MRP subunit POP5